MKKLRGVLFTALLLLTAGQIFAVRTVVFMYKQTVTGQDIFIKGGHDAGLVPSVYPSMSEPITYFNTLNTTTAAIKANDASLDWGSESALDWTTSLWPASWGAKKTYAVDGYGEDPENTMGDHWWKFDVDMLGTSGDWFEFKAFMRQGTAESWENNIAQAGTPYATINHWGKKGYITKVTFGANTVTFVPLSTPVNQPPVAALTATPATADTGVAISFSAAGSTDPEGGALQYQFDWENDGTYDTAYSSTASASHSYSTAGTYTVKVQVKDVGGLTATKTVSVTVTAPTTQTLTVHYRNSSAWSTPKMHWGYNYYLSVADLATSGTDSFGVKFTLNWNNAYTYLTTCFNNGSTTYDGVDRRIDKPTSFPKEVWILNNDSVVYASNPIDAVPPTVALSAPANGASLTGTVTMSATASDNVAVTKVEFYYGTTKIGEDTSSPYSISWNTTLVPNGSYTITAKAFDAAGNNTTSASRTVTTANANVPPVANAGADITIVKGGTAQFNGTGSYDPNGSIVSYQWSNGLTGATPTKVYATTGDYTVTLTVTDNNGATATDTVIVHVVDQLASDFREETVYFIMTDRFADGNPNNNTIWGGEYTSDIYNIWDQSKSGVLSYYHGGDFQGIINNLDYIQSLGFTAIWITPVVKQPEGRHVYDPNDPITGGGGDWYSASAYHGYWGYDFDKIDPHLHNSGKTSDGWTDFDALVNALHSRGMKLMLDIVVNHGHPTAVSQTSSTFSTRQTIKMDGQTWTWITGDPYYNAAQSPHTDGFFSYANGTWLIDLIDFNENGTYNARAHLKNVYKRFIDHGVDAFRIDTVAYMTAGFWKDFTDTMKSYAASKGKPNFYMCGEAWTGDRTAAVGLIYNGGLNKSFNMLDLHGSSMDFPGWMGNAFKGERGFDDSNGWLRISGQYGDQSGLYDPTFLATFVDNHDVTRANGILNQTQYMNNLNFIYLFRGIPIVYYGTEILYSSWPNYIQTTDKNDIVARWMLGTEGINYVKNNSPMMSRHIKMLNSLRKSSVALQKGQQTDLYVLGDGIVSKRDAGANVAFVGLSKGGGFSYTVTGIPSGTYRKITPDTANASYTVQTVSITSGSYTLTVPANSFVMLDK